MEWTPSVPLREMQFMSTVSPSHRYSFESENSRREARQADTFLSEFKKRRLRLLDDDLDELLLEFATHVHVNIAWYTRAIHRERWRKRLFFVVTAGIVGFLPFALARPDWGFVPDGNDATTRTTMILTGLIGFYNSFRTWLQHYSGMGRFHEASSKLKELLYSFEAEWMEEKPQSLTGEERERFISEVTRVTAEARQIVREETRQHFETATTLPDINPWTMLTSARATAKTVAEEIGPKPDADQISREELEATIREKSELITQLRKLESDWQKEMASASPERKTELKGAIRESRAKQIAAQHEIAAARASLAR